MKKIITRCIGVSLLIGILAGNLFSKTDYFAYKEGVGYISISKRMYQTGIRLGKEDQIRKDTEFSNTNAFQGATLTLAIFFIGYSLKSKTLKLKK